MGKDKKAKAADKKLKIVARQERKVNKKEKKHASKAKNADDSDADDVDIDSVLAEYARQQEQFLKVTETPCKPPSARSSATLLANPANSNELFLFGGEYYNGALAHFYNDLVVYNIKHDEWRTITSPNTPLPRSGHAWTRGGNAGGIYLFGGEFSSPKQGTFYHYNDFWRLDPQSREWTRIEFKGKGPPARSGHRMTYFKNYIILFGGFQDTSQQTKYLQDVWIYDTSTFVWHTPILPPATGKPEPRSSFTFLPHERGAVLYGGYSRVKGPAGKSSQAKGAAAGGAGRTVLKPMVHQDTWFLRITPPPAEAPSNTLPKVVWERRKRPANPPNPARAGATMAYHKGRGIMFGGVYDIEESEEGIDSEFFNQLFAWNVERNRYFSLTLRRPRAAPKKGGQGAERGRRGRGKADEEELLRNLAALETKGRLAHDEGDKDIPDALKNTESDEETANRPEKAVVFEMPHPRFNAQLTVQNDVLYIYGGTFEKGDREYTFDDLWAIDLGKLDGVKEIFKRELDDWAGSEDEMDEDEEEEEEEDSDVDSDFDEDKSDTASVTTAATSIPDASNKPTEDEEEESTATVDDGLPHPRPFETLRDFYARTSEAWQNIEIDTMNRASAHPAAPKSVKEIKTAAFERAEDKWWDTREEIRVLEDEQEQAGIGEVVSLADKEGGKGGVRTRR
ncbi:galactose oxidase [Pseudovirgaria hyperparasitica]|uniref:Galactose oxidase n=1 Tax=Pseudovirgaria hyperparasitica TaxID=470096 RepID=A0A6A6W5U2_9PEZI|nr:galactose oxidase [Pseudovirgaria hyperparasitica]KAF2758252.1 galactose oxidase [Pseudovirgaria hyperparasitica]